MGTMPAPSQKFSESNRNQWSEEREALLQRRIDELGLKIEGTRLEPLIQQLYRELDQAGISLKPRVYLSDEWGCPEGIPVIGIPFYLADERLRRLEDELMEGVEAESDEEILSYLRHEAGHAFNYAYRLYETEEWHKLFGPYSRPYRDDYEPNPFSRNFVRHLPGWYAQKHPDEDFAESFAVWLDPESNWRETYAEWGCYPKLLYVDRIARAIGRTSPPVTAEGFVPGAELGTSLAEHYRRFGHRPVEVPAYFDGDLKDLFARGPKPENAEWEPADRFISRARRQLVGNISYWTGLNENIVRGLIEHFAERARALDLWLAPEDEQRTLLELVAYATTLCMNRLYKGDFVIK
jgi:hypothetical protein